MTFQWIQKVRNWKTRIAQSEQHRRFLFWLLAGVLLRLAIMPFFCHADLLSEYRRVYMTIDTGFFLPQLTRLVVYYIELLFLFISLPFLPSADSLFFFSDLANSTAGLPDYFLFVSDPLIFRTLFLLKMPYLIFDMGTAVLIFRMLEGKSRQFTAFLLWLFNPVTLYAFYFFGRFESISVFFLALTLRMVQQHRLVGAAVAMGLALNCREVNLVFAPVFFLSLIDPNRSWVKNTVRMLPVVGIVVGLYVLPQFAARLLDATPLYYGKTTLEMGRAGHLLDFRIHWFLGFVFSYFLICFWLVEWHRDSFYRLVMAWGLTMLAFFFFTSHSAHYVSWLMLFPLTLLYFNVDMVKPTLLLCCTWIGLWLFATDAGVFTLLLASPLSIHFSGIPHLPQWYIQNLNGKSFFDLDIVILILNNLFHAGLAYMGYKFFREKSQ